MGTTEAGRYSLRYGSRTLDAYYQTTSPLCGAQYQCAGGGEGAAGAVSIRPRGLKSAAPCQAASLATDEVTPSGDRPGAGAAVGAERRIAPRPLKKP